MGAVASRLPQSPNSVEPVREKPSYRGLITFFFFAVLSFLVIVPDKAPGPVSGNAPLTVFSAERAMAHLGVISRAPHPVNSAEHALVRDYIVHTLQDLGLAPQVQTTEGPLENIAARLKGSSPGKAVLVVAHYDSVAAGPGASDDGVAVAALLESARVLKALPQLKRDVIFLFTDGEERGLLGARAFVSEHPWAHDVGVVLNFEARGTSGPSIMFETSDANGWMISNFGKAASHPVANSLSYEIYKRLPNDTDFTIFREAGYSGLNFAFIDGLAYYHTRLDSLERVNQGSLQHQGDYVTEMAAQFGNAASDDPKPANRTYFDVLGTVLVRYSQSTAAVFLGLTVIMTFLALYLGIRNRHLRIGASLLALVAMVAGIAITTLGAWAVSWIAFQMRAIPRIRLGLRYESQWYILAALTLGIACGVAFYSWMRTKIGASNLMAGTFLGWLSLTVLMSVYLPGGTYLFLWPLFFSVLGAMVTFAREPAENTTNSWVLVLSGIPAIVLLVPMMHKLYWAFAAQSAIITGVLAGLLLSLLAAMIGAQRKSRGWLLPVLLIIAGTGLFVTAVVISPVS